MGESRSWPFVHQIYLRNIFTTCLLRSHTHPRDSDSGLTGVCVCYVSGCVEIHSQKTLLTLCTPPNPRDQMRGGLFACGFFAQENVVLVAKLLKRL